MANYLGDIITYDVFMAAMEEVAKSMNEQKQPDLPTRLDLGTHFVANIDSSGVIWINEPILVYLTQILGKNVSLSATGNITLYWEGRSQATTAHPNDHYIYPITNVYHRHGAEIGITANFGTTNWTWFQVGVYIANGLYATIT